jgi:hypothetical protein
MGGKDNLWIYTVCANYNTYNSTSSFMYVENTWFRELLANRRRSSCKKIKFFIGQLALAKFIGISINIHLYSKSCCRHGNSRSGIAFEVPTIQQKIPRPQSCAGKSECEYGPVKVQY